MADIIKIDPRVQMRASKSELIFTWRVGDTHMRVSSQSTRVGVLNAILREMWSPAFGWNSILSELWYSRFWR